MLSVCLWLYSPFIPTLNWGVKFYLVKKAEDFSNSEFPTPTDEAFRCDILKTRQHWSQRICTKGSPNLLV